MIWKTILLILLLQTNGFAATIIDIREESTVVGIERISECDWYELIELRTYRKYIDTYIVYYNKPVSIYKPHPNPCFPRPIDAWEKGCDPAPVGATFTGTYGLNWWDDMVLSTLRIHHYTCTTCNHLATPEPTSLIMVLVSLGAYVCIKIIRLLMGIFSPRTVK